jgi:signal transduction histidine kinase
MIKDIGLEPAKYATNENENVRRNGERVWVTWTNKAVKGNDGQTVEILCVGNDITERRRGEEALRKARDELELQVRERTAQVSRTNQELMGEILDYVIVQACRLLGTDAGAVYRLQPDRKLLAIQAAQGLPPEYVASVTIPVGQGAVGQAVLERRPVPICDVQTAFPENHPLMRDPERRTHLVAMATQYRALLGIPLMVKDEVYGGIVLYNTEPRQFSDDEIELAMVFGDQAALAIENARLRAQAEETAIAAERSRLARDLHDAVTQTLFSASLIAEVLPRLWERDIEEGRRRLEELRQLTRGALAEMRTLLLELRPAALMEAGLGDLLRQLCEAITGRARVPVTLTVEGQQVLPADVHIVLYRIAQEALNNVAKHAEAVKVVVSLKYRHGKVELSVRDDGCGFDPAQVSSEHLGLNIMRERAEAIGADLVITSQPGHGSQVLVTWQDRQRREDT